jgi:hypothetical protein
VDLYGSGQGPIACPCKDGNKYSVFMFGRIFLSKWATVDFSMRSQFHVVTCSKDLMCNFALKYEINAGNSALE